MEFLSLKNTYIYIPEYETLFILCLLMLRNYTLLKYASLLQIISPVKFPKFN